MKNILIIFGCLLLMIQLIQAKETRDSLKNYQMGEIVVKGDNTTDINIIEVDREALLRTSPGNASEGMRFLPGINIIDDSRGTSNIYLRGFEQRQISVFKDGAPLSTQFNGISVFDNFPLACIGNIRIANSTVSGLYGANASGGAINLISKMPMKSNSMELNLLINPDDLHGDLNYSGRYDDIFYQVGLNYAKAENFNLSDDFQDTTTLKTKERINTDFERKSAFLKLGYNFKDYGRAFLSADIIDNEYSVPWDIYTSKIRYWRYPEWKANLFNMVYENSLSKNVNIRTNAFMQIYENTFESYDDINMNSMEMKWAFSSLHKDNILGANIISDYNIEGFGFGSLKFMFRNDVHKEIDDIGMDEEEYSASLVTVGLIQGWKVTDNFLIRGGIGMDMFMPDKANGTEKRDKESLLKFNFGSYYKFSDNYNLFAAFSTNGRFPTLKELYSDIMEDFIKNPDLAKEESLNFEIGTEINPIKKLRIKGTFFYSDIRNLIQITALYGGSRTYENIGKAVLSGLELNLKYNTDKDWFDVNFTYLNAINHSNRADNDYLNYRPEFIFNMIYSREFIMNFGLQYELSIIGNQHTDYYGTWKDIKSFAFMNIKLFYEFSESFELFFRANNLNDKLYQTRWGYPQPGRRLYLGVRAKFDHE